MEESTKETAFSYSRADGTEIKPAEIALDFMDAIGESKVAEYARRKSITKQQRPLLLEMSKLSVETYLRTGSWAVDLSDGKLVEKDENGKYEATPELETSQPTILVPNGLLRELQMSVDRMTTILKITKTGSSVVERPAKSVTAVEPSNEEKVAAVDKDVKRGKILTAEDVMAVAERIGKGGSIAPTPVTPKQMRELEAMPGFTKAEAADV